MSSGRDRGKFVFWRVEISRYFPHFPALARLTHRGSAEGACTPSGIATLVHGKGKVVPILSLDTRLWFA